VFNVNNLSATTSTEEKAEFLRDIGVDAVINYEKRSFDSRIWVLTDRTGVDARVAERWTTHHVEVTAGLTPETEHRLLFIRQLDHVGSSGVTTDELTTFCECVSDVTVEPVIRDTFNWVY